MEINFNVKVKAGPRTPPQVTVYSTSVNEKWLTYANGRTDSEHSIAIQLQHDLEGFIKMRQDMPKL